jgi:ubiquinone/menaquinone biosynthesis C-methylase UbiE
MIEALAILLKDSSAKVMQANALDLDAIGDASISHYVANMTIHIVPDVALMLRECLRVLKDQGVAGFTFWYDR